MNKQAKVANISPEKQAWELFEVGSYEEVIEFASRYPNNSLLKHLSAIAMYENGEGNVSAGVLQANEGKSVFSPLAKAYIQYHLNNKLEAASLFNEYIQTQNRPLCFSILNFGVKASYEARAYANCLQTLELNRSVALSDSFIREKLNCYYYLKKFKEFVYFFKTKYKLIEKDFDLQLKAGLVLHNLGKYKESELILSRVPGKVELPSFEEKKKDFEPVMKKINDLEKRDVLSFEEWKNLGFAYLFNSEYGKAEEAFKKAALALQ
ncbi:MAG: hypothetical protein H7A25_17990 [Leptospiraceae bacterium]|nr:hypothetical protein [Leptospiraceae bacterium]MCP5501800.1 hypothetical protein [Leptospiraceae bacterium]